MPLEGSNGRKECTDMRYRRACFTALFVIVAGSVCGQAFELGVVGGGGLVFTNGSFFDIKSTQLAELGAASLSSLGTTTADLFPCWSAGVYAEMILDQWFSLRLEAHGTLQGASRLALTDAGVPFDRYGVYYFNLTIPLFAKARLPLAGGVATISAGPFLGMILSDIYLIDRYVSSTTTLTVAQDFIQGVNGGVAGGAGYSHKLGPGSASLELRAEWALTSATVNDSALGGDIFPLNVSILAGYGFQLKESDK